MTVQLELAILQILKEGGSWMPSNIVGRLRENFDPASIRPVLEDMHLRRVIAAEGYAYCFPENVEAIRADHLNSLQSEYGTEMALRHPAGRERYERIWRAVENWDGFGDRNLDLCTFKTVRFR